MQKKEEETDLKIVEVWLAKVLLDVAHRVRPEVDSNKTDKNWNTYQSSRARSARLRCSDRSRVEVTWPEPKLSKTRQGSSFSSEKERNKKTTNSEVNMNEMILQQVLKELFWYSYGLGGFGFESSFTLLSFQARQFTRNARSYFLQIIDDFENARICERTGLARLFKLSLQRKICKNPALKRSLSQCSDLWVRMLMNSVRGLKGNKPSQTKKDFFDASPIIASCINTKRRKLASVTYSVGTSSFSFLRYWLCSDSSL